MPTAIGQARKAGITFRCLGSRCAEGRDDNARHTVCSPTGDAQSSLAFFCVGETDAHVDPALFFFREVLAACVLSPAKRTLHPDIDKYACVSTLQYVLPLRGIRSSTEVSIEASIKRAQYQRQSLPDSPSRIPPLSAPIPLLGFRWHLARAVLGHCCNGRAGLRGREQPNC